MRKFIAFKLVCFGIWIMELEPYGFLDEQDKIYLKKLWEKHDEFKDLK